MPSSRRPDIESFLPLKPAILHILLALHGSARHGYGIIQRVETQSGGSVSLPTGAFYRHLAWLLEHGLLEESPDRPPDADPRRGSYYRLTALGERVLAAEGGRLQDVLSVIEETGVLPGERTA
ncbi:MAG: PadR family transcriptional regulator [Gemmatimonadota bacterium]|nr:PadR family transcriptional regulator [Gemmatimonadota bacterium]